MRSHAENRGPIAREPIRATAAAVPTAIAARASRPVSSAAIPSARPAAPIRYSSDPTHQNTSRLTTEPNAPPSSVNAGATSATDAGAVNGERGTRGAAPGPICVPRARCPGCDEPHWPGIARWSDSTRQTTSPSSPRKKPRQNPLAPDRPLLRMTDRQTNPSTSGIAKTITNTPITIAISAPIATSAPIIATSPTCCTCRWTRPPRSTARW